MAAFGEQNLTRKSLTEFAQSQARYWPNGAVNKIYPTGLGALDINESTEIYPEWVWQYWMHTGDRTLLASVYRVLRRICRLHPTSRLAGHGSGDVAALDQRLLRLSRRDPAQRPRRQRVPPHGIGRRGAGPTPERGLPPTPATGCAGRRGQPPAHPARRHLRRRADGRGFTDPHGVADGQRLRGGIRGGPDRAHRDRGPLREQSRYAGPAPECRRGPGGHGRGRPVRRSGRRAWWTPPPTAGPTSCPGGPPSPGRCGIPPTPTGTACRTAGARPWSPRSSDRSSGCDPPVRGSPRSTSSPLPAGWPGPLGSVPTPRGTISVAWSAATAEDKTVSVEATVPPNSTAVLTVAAQARGGLTEGGAPITAADGVRFLGISDGAARLELGAGTYRIRSAQAP